MRRAAAMLGMALVLAMGGDPGLRPFFDTQDEGPGDPAPAPPPVSTFDRAMLDLCGAWGTSPESSAFLDILRRFPAHRTALHSALGTADDERLSHLWFRHDGLAHVLCGEPGPDRLGGLHWRARYWQAQQEGWAGRMSASECPRTEVVPPVYTVGTWYRRNDGGLGAKCPNGYAYTEDALDILVDTTAALRQAGFPDRRTACLGTGRHPGGDFPLVVVMQDGAVVTSYPDASPPPRLKSCTN